MQKTIKELTDLELRAVRGDLYVERDRILNMLSIVNGELENREANKPKEVKEVPRETLEEVLKTETPPVEEVSVPSQP